MSQVITVTFAPGQTEAVADQPLDQWAYGQKLKFLGLDLPTVYQVDFSNWEFKGKSIPQIGNADGVTVPTEVLISCRNVYAFLWVQVPGSGRRQYRVTARVTPGPAPNPQEPNPEETSAIAELITELNDAVTDAETAVSHYPKIVNEYWYVWDVENRDYVNTGVKASGEGGGGGGSDKVWWATYGTTTAAEIEAAVAAEKIVATKRQESADTEYICFLMGIEKSYTYDYYVFVGSDLTGFLTVALQVTKATGTEAWLHNPRRGGPSPASTPPADLAANAAIGSSTRYARADHVHKLPSATDVGALPATGGTLSGALAMGGNRITGLGAATADTDAVTKKQLSDAIAGLGTVFNIQGDVATVADLPATGNSVGDVYYVQAVQAAFIWLETTEHPSGYWEEFGEPIDLSGYIEKPSNASANQILTFDGTFWTAANKPSYSASEVGALPDNTAIPAAATTDPADLGTKAVGVSLKYARADHVHQKPSASDIGAIAAPASATTGDFLCWDGTAWAATTMPTYNGGSY